MNEGLNHPPNRSNRRQRRRRRNFSSNQQQNGQQQQGRQQGQGANRQNRNRNRGQRRGPAAFVGPMDHSYRNQNGGGGQPGHYKSAHASENLPPLPTRDDAPTRIFALVDDLFFLAKINEVARKLNVKVEFIKSEKEIAEKTGENPEDRPSLIVVDLNSNSIKPLSVIPKLRSKFKKPTSIVGFVSHVQGDLKVKAQEAGCDVVMPRSAFSQNLPSILRRHGAEDEPEQDFNRA